MTGRPARPPQLPPTIGHRWVTLPLIRPGHGRWQVWLVDAAHDLAFDAAAVVAELELTGPELIARFPIDWHHDGRLHEDDRPGDTVLLWRAASVVGAVREFSKLALRDLEYHEKVDAFIDWVSAQYQGLCVEDPQRTLDEALPTSRGSAGEEFPVAAAARRLAVRYGSGVTRQKLFELMGRLGWVERTGLEGAPWRVLLTARASKWVSSRVVRHPKGRYEQVFLTPAGLAVLAEQLRAEVEQPLVDLTEEAGQ